MNQKRKLKPWVKTFLLLLPEIIIILQLFVLCNYVKEIINEQPQINVYTLKLGGSNV